MKINKLLIVIVACLLVTSTFAALQVFAVQPTLVPGTYYIGTIGQPRRLDPARAYDTASSDVIMNCYETLVFFKDKPDAPLPNVDGATDMGSVSLWANISDFEPIVAENLPVITNGGLDWTFTINTSVMFKPWIMANNSVYPAMPVSALDVEYSLERILVQDMAGSPSWMFSMPGFGTMWNIYDPVFNSGGQWDPAIYADRLAAATAFENFVTTSGDDVTIHWGQAWPPGVLMQILAQTWGGIGQQAFCVEHGAWTGTYYDDMVAAPNGIESINWIANYTRKPSNSYSPLDRWHTTSKYTNNAAGNKNGWGNGDVPACMGTGPYNFTSWDKINKIWRMDAYKDYYKGWAGAGDMSGSTYDSNNFIKTVLEKGIDIWPTRKMLFLEGEFDVVACPRANMWDLLEENEKYDPIEGVNLYYGHGGLANEMAPFVFEVDSGSPYRSKVGGVICDDFFGNYYVRRAFGYAVNYTDYLENAWFGEAVQQDSWWVDGLEPPAYKNTALVHKTLNTTTMLAELAQAYFPAASNTSSVRDLGFETYLVYNSGNDQRKIMCDMIASAWRAIDPKYNCHVVAIDWPTFLDYEEQWWMPMFFVGWLADFADCDNFVRPYMNTYGDFSYFQRYSDPDVDAAMDAAILMPDTNPDRGWIYKDLQAEYYNASVGLPVCQATNRRWVRDWVFGWYYNPLYPGGYYYDQIYKKQTATVENVDLSVTGTITRLVFYDKVYWIAGAGLIGSEPPYESGNLNYAIFSWNVSVSRLDTDAPTTVLAALGVRRYNSSTYFEYCNATIVQLVQGGKAYAIEYWYEDGLASNTFAPEMYWNMTAHTNPSTGIAKDTDLSNNDINDTRGTYPVVGPITADLKVDGLVDLFDAIVLSNAYGAFPGDDNWNEAANLKVDYPIPPNPEEMHDLETIDLFDAIILSGNFGAHAP